MHTENKLPIHFAPLQGFTDAPYRNAHQAIFGGVTTYYTPFVRLEKGDNFRMREIREITLENNTVSHLIPQLIASVPEEFEKIAALFEEKGHTQADINMGCPFPMLARRHKGSGILPYPEEVKAVLACIAKFPNIKFSLKMRLGWDSAQECMDLLPLLNELPLQHITLHARLGKQQYKGETDWDAFEAFYKACKHPIIYNGDITTIEELYQLSVRFPNLAGVMMGRGLLANPALAMEYKQGVSLTQKELYDKIRELHIALLSHYEAHLEGDAQLLCKMKTLWEYLLPDMDRKIKKKIHKSTKMESYRAAVAEGLRL